MASGFAGSRARVRELSVLWRRDGVVSDGELGRS